MEISQNKNSEISFFDSHSGGGEYNVFTPKSSDRMIDTLLSYAGLKAPLRVADLGCGSGVFTHRLTMRGFDATGIDLSPGMIRIAKEQYPKTSFQVGDVENLPFESGSLDAVLLSGILHHFTHRKKFLSEVHRVLKPGGKVMAFDPNRMNPFVYLYRDRTSPLYSSVGVTENERPVVAKEIRAEFIGAGFEVKSEFISNIHFQYMASPLARTFLFAYNFLDTLLFAGPLLRPLRSFVLTIGSKV